MIVKPERRDFMRMAIDSEAVVRFLPHGDPMQVSLADLSASGCSFDSVAGFEPGQQIEVLITSPSKSIEPFRRRAEVIRVASADGPFRVAVRFAEDDSREPDPSR